MSTECSICEVSTRIGCDCHKEKPAAASAGYSCWQLFTVRTINGGESVQGCIPLITLPASLVGKTVKVTIEEQL